MSDLIFSVNVTIPIFLVMVVGYFLRRIGMLNDSFVAAANKFNFKVTLPVMLFRDLSTSFRSSAAVMGLAFIQNIYGSATMGSLMIIGAVPLYNIYSVIVLTFEGNTPETERDAGKIRQAGINILKNPIIIGIVLGLIVALFHNPMPTLVNKTVDSIAQMATPLALVALGAGFEGRNTP